MKIERPDDTDIAGFHGMAYIFQKDIAFTFRLQVDLIGIVVLLHGHGVLLMTLNIIKE